MSRIIGGDAGGRRIGTPPGQHTRPTSDRVREALYMAAVAVTRTKSRFARIYRAMRDAGKPAKVALIAIARKIVVAANAIVKHDTPWTPNPS